MAAENFWENELLSIYKLLKRKDLSHPLHHFLSSLKPAFQKKTHIVKEKIVKSVAQSAAARRFSLHAETRGLIKS